MILRSEDNKVFKTASAALFDKRSETEVATINDIDGVDDFMAEIGESDINPSLALTANGSFKEDKLLSVLPPSGGGDFTVTGGGNAVSQRSDGTWQINWPANTPRYTWNDGVPSILVESQRQNLITYPRSFSNAYWTKEGATIEGDPTTAGSELVVNGGFDTDTDWQKGGNWNISGGKANINGVGDLSQAGVYGNANTIKITFEVSNFVSRSTFRLIDYNGTILHTFNFTDNGTVTAYYCFSGIASKNFYFRATNCNFSIDNVSVKEVSGFSCPFVDSSGVNTLEGFKLVEDTSNTSHNISSVDMAAAC